MKSEFNITSEDRLVKTTINIRTRMMTGVHQRMHELYKEDFVDYLRDLIQLDLKHKILGSDMPISLTKFRDQLGWPRKETGAAALKRIKNRQTFRKGSDQGQRFYPDPPRKYPGFIAGLCRNFRVLGWSRKCSDEARSARVRLAEES